MEPVRLRNAVIDLHDISHLHFPLSLERRSTVQGCWHGQKEGREVDKHLSVCGAFRGVGGQQLFPTKARG